MKSINILRRRSPGAGGSAPYGSHRYWRIYVTTNNGDATFIAINEVEMRLSAGGANQCSGGTAIRSSEQVGNEATKAFDSNLTNAWAPATNANEWIGYDFGAGNAKAIAEVALLCGNGGGANIARSPKTGNVAYSDDGTTWTTAFSYTIQGWLSGENRVLPEATLAANTHRFWRVYVPTVNSSILTTLSEIEFRAAVSGADQSPVCTTYDMGISGRTIQSSDNTGNESWRVFDSSVASGNGWAGNTAPQWVGFLFPVSGALNVQEVLITTYSDSRWIPTALNFDYSDDGVTWTTKRSVTGLSLSSSTAYAYSTP